MTFLAPADAFEEWKHVPSRLAYHSPRATHGEPVLTIAIPAFRRFDLLCEAVRSAMVQDFKRPFEVIVVDNDPDSDNAEHLLDAIPEIASIDFRYYVNAQNIGMFGNWNRCIELGQAEWHTLLNDDDLLDNNFVSSMFRVLDRKPDIDALICRKRTLDERPGRPTAPAGTLHRLLQQAWLEARFWGRSARQIHPRLLFWGGTLGNTVGMIARKGDLLQLGGYQPEEYPTADWYLQVRLALRLHFAQHRAVLASIRIAVNESMKPGIWKGFFQNGRRMHLMLAGTVLPRWWAKMSPYLIEIYRVDATDGLNQRVSREDVSRELCLSLPRDHRRVMTFLRAILRGY